MATTKGFIKDWAGRTILPITRGELVLDSLGNMALTSDRFLAGEYKDADGNIIATDRPGLITAAERAILTGGGAGQGISDIYAKLGHINSGVQVNGQTLNFYTAEGAATPIKVGSEGDNKINITLGESNSVNLGLAEIHTGALTASQILKSISVDKYGRVTAVTGEALTNTELPAEISGKTISNATLSGCVTADKEIANDEKAVANKAYVDAKFQEVSGIATGALKFGGPLSDATTANNALTNSDAWNSYYKVTKEFEISTSNLYDTTSIVGNTITVKAGDTLIVYPVDGVGKFVYVPSGDDITSLTVVGAGENSNALTSEIGDITLKFSEVFSVKNVADNKTATISLLPASESQDGYLSATDYAAFKAYKNELAVSYTGEFSSGNGVYKIGTLTIGGVDTSIFGKNNIAALTLTDGTTDAYNPILKFTETDATDVNITFKGGAGIKVVKNGDAIEFAAANTILSDSSQYLEVKEGHQFGVKLGSVGSNGEVTNGLVNFETFHNLSLLVAETTKFEEIDYTLVGNASDKYQYGNDKLKAAITITI